MSFYTHHRQTEQQQMAQTDTRMDRFTFKIITNESHLKQTYLNSNKKKSVNYHLNVAFPQILQKEIKLDSHSSKFYTTKSYP